MKAQLFSFALTLFALWANASDLTTACQNTSETPSSYSPQVCQFSLTSYSGTISSNGYTNSIKVGLSCPQATDVRATVVVYIDNNLVASKVVTIKAGDDYSSGVAIFVGTSYSGKTYELGVQ